jgi:hypothetical protein
MHGEFEEGMLDEPLHAWRCCRRECARGTTCS